MDKTNSQNKNDPKKGTRMREPPVHTLRNPIKTKLAVIIYLQRILCGPSGPVYAVSVSVSSYVEKHHFKSIKF